MQDVMQMEPGRSARRGTVVVVTLTAILAARALWYVFYLPLFEGPDEPFHLGRAASLAARTSEHILPSEIVSSIKRHRCGPDLSSAFGCEPHDGASAFNVLQRGTHRDSPREEVQNYEAHQPPLYYLVAARMLRITPAAESPAGQLLVLRLLSLTLVAFALAVPIRRILDRHARSATYWCLIFLAAPGALEALIRASNDAMLFLWAALLWDATESRERGHRVVPPLLIVLCAIGPLIKLTAFPVIAASVATLWLHDDRKVPLYAAIASLIVFPVQAARGWGWGGTYELNRAVGVIDESSVALGVGVARSIYTFAKTIFWLGGWTVFRAPLVLVVCYFALIAVSLLFLRVRLTKKHTIAHAIGVVVAAGGFLLLAVLNRKLFGAWGGLGGWYFWGWFPWLLAGSSEAMTLRRHAGALIALSAAFVIAANLLWFRSAAHIYGPLWP